ncbi:MAG: hypothetical protein HC802_21115, partial [Caldilineaceae bacterium]|nr:hypothetical protein [Caldilineaceae bacterium]
MKQLAVVPSAISRRTSRRTSILLPRLFLLVALLLVQGGGRLYAQDEGSAPSVSVTRIDTNAFPAVTTYVDAVASDGLPLAGLNASNFSLLEDGAPIPGPLTVVRDTSQPLNLVLALDRSTSAANWAVVQSAVNI